MLPGCWLTRTDDGRATLLTVGDVIGRSPRAAMIIDDPRISEAHAMVSFRGRGLVMLSLRGPLTVDDREADQIALDPGTVVAVAPGISLVCDAVELPPSVPGVRINEGPAQVLWSTTSVWVTDPPILRAGVEPDADAILWPHGTEWRMRTATFEGALTLGQRLPVGAGSVELVSVPLEQTRRTRTRPLAAAPRRFIFANDWVSVRDGDRQLAITGVQGRLLATILRTRQPQSWRDLCATIWPDDRSSETSLRNRLDVTTARLRQRLREAGLGDIALAFDGAGFAHLRLCDGDEVQEDGDVQS